MSTLPALKRETTVCDTDGKELEVTLESITEKPWETAVMDFPMDENDENVLFPANVDPNFFTFGDVERKRHSRPDNFIVKIGYKGPPLVIQTPRLTNIWGLKGFNSPGVTYKSFSLAWSLPTKKDVEGNVQETEITNFLGWLEGMDEFFKAKAEKLAPNLKYFSPVRPPLPGKNYPPHLRTKLKTKSNSTFQGNFFNGRGPSFEWSMNDEWIKHGDEAELILELSPLWANGNGLIGISWKIINIRKIPNQFNFIT